MGLTVHIADTVRVECAAGIDTEIARELLGMFPHNAKAGKTYLALGRASAASVLEKFPDARVNDLRAVRAHEAGGDMKAVWLPKKDGYSLDAFAAGEGGFVFMLRNCWHRAVPNLVRNLAWKTGQSALVITPDLEKYADASNHLFPDWKSYTLVVTPAALAAEPEAVNEFGLVVAYDCMKHDPAVVGALETCLARWRFVIDDPKYSNLCMAAGAVSSIGPVLLNNARSPHLRVVPVATPFFDAARRAAGGYSAGRALDLKETAWRLLDDELRLQIFSHLFERTRAERNLVLASKIFVARELQKSLRHHNPVVIVPAVHSSDAAVKAAVKKIKETVGPITIILTYDDAAKYAGMLPDCGCAYLLDPVGARRTYAALEPLRRKSNDIQHSVYDLVDYKILELQEKADVRHAFLSSVCSCSVADLDKRYCR